MADWKKLLKSVLLDDGSLDKRETEILKNELMADGVIDDEEVDFLVDLKNSSKECSPEFIAFFFEALASNILEDGIIDSQETTKIREILFADGVIDSDEIKFLQTLKAKAKVLSPEFTDLFKAYENNV